MLQPTKVSKEIKKTEKIGRTPLEIAALYGRDKIAQYLAQKLGVPVPVSNEKPRNTELMKQPFQPPAPDSKKD
jgi:ankyrin repeat protein